MDASTALRTLTHRAEMAYTDDEKARTLLAERLGQGAATDLSQTIDAALVASANAKPWRQLMKRVEAHGVREGLAKQKAEVMEVLLSYGMGMSTSLVANAARLAEQDGQRRFLNAVDTIEVDEVDEAADAEPAKVAEAPVNVAAAVEVPKVTPAQKRTLQAIKTAGVRLQQFRTSGSVCVETAPGHDRPRRDMVEHAIDQKWAQRDTSTSLYRGQAVTLTPLGEAILAR
ncbi:hypothetical protein [Streptomyces sp. NPDC053560]|uniref:hypothetical protein n=1 Tax=Streptomyces sp. NPDC053560 TaxID=3365711 RepID=UPI0037CD92DC